MKKILLFCLLILTACQSLSETASNESVVAALNLSADHSESLINEAQKVVQNEDSEENRSQNGIRVISEEELEISRKIMEQSRIPFEYNETMKIRATQRPKVVGKDEVQVKRIEKMLDLFKEQALENLTYIELKPNSLTCQESESNFKKFEECTIGEYVVESGQGSVYYSDSLFTTAIVIYSPDRQSDEQLKETLHDGLRHHYEYIKYGESALANKKNRFIETAVSLWKIRPYDTTG